MRKAIIPIIVILCIIFIFYGIPVGIRHYIEYNISPVAPKYEQGEFPFRIVYEVANETVKIEDTLVVKYKGFSFGEEKQNKWNAYYLSDPKDNSNDLESVTTVSLYQGNDEDGKPVTIQFLLGSCEYYMGLEEPMQSVYYTLFDAGDIIIQYTDGFQRVINDEELSQKYGIRIIEKRIGRTQGDGSVIDR